MSSASPSPSATNGLNPRRWATFVVTLSATFMDLVDTTVINVALPSLRRELHASRTQLEWSIAGYVLAFASGMITASRLGDRFGRLRVFQLGLLAFTITSALTGLAVDPEMLIAARIAQGASAALMVPQVLAMLRVEFPPGEQSKAAAPGIEPDEAGGAVRAEPDRATVRKDPRPALGQRRIPGQRRGEPSLAQQFRRKLRVGLRTVRDQQEEPLPWDPGQCLLQFPAQPGPATAGRHQEQRRLPHQPQDRTVPVVRGHGGAPPTCVVQPGAGTADGDERADETDGSGELLLLTEGAARATEHRTYRGCEPGPDGVLAEPPQVEHIRAAGRLRVRGGGPLGGARRGVPRRRGSTSGQAAGRRRRAPRLPIHRAA
ncbi:MFS transporter [Streptomyces sp. NPDC090052]|uniref:MFS transporter n=1 Tax=Streptomyces sp. NPDC090052 TaxID=3365931 RepID=UPI00381894B9